MIELLKQTGHETDSYNTLTEYTNRDGTNAYCARYDGGCRYKGRGAIQLTHRRNYVRAGNELGVDFVNSPDVVATPQYAFQVAGLYWKWTNLNKCSDARDLTACTRLINGGTNGIADRKNKYSSAQRCITALGGRSSGNGNSAPSQSPSSNGDCTVNGARGQCIDVSANACTGTVYRGYCSGPANIRCCVGGSRAVAGETNSFSTSETAQLAPGTIVVVVLSALVAVTALAVLVVILVRRRQEEADSARP